MDTVEREIGAAIHSVFEQGAIEEELIDVDEVTSLRNPSLTGDAAASTLPAPEKAERERTASVAVQKPPMPSPNPKNYNQRRHHLQPSPQPKMHASPVTSKDESESPASSENVTEVPSLVLFISTLPWWIWLLIGMLLFALGGLKVAVGKLLQEEEEIFPIMK